MNSIKTHIISFGVLLGIATLSQAQTSLIDNAQLGTTLHTGWNLPEYQFLSYLSEDYVRGVDLTFSIESTGKNDWEQIFNYPSCGISLFYSSLGNDDLIGRELALTYFFKVDLIRKERFKFYNRTGIGLGYVNRRFDLIDNYWNVAVGSKANIHFNLRWGVDYELTDRLELDSGISLDHFSNANTSEPNLGINYVTGYLGVNYRLRTKKEKIVSEIVPHEPETTYALYTSIGGKHARSLSSQYFLTSSLSLQAERSITKAFYLGLGADVFYDSSQETQLTELGKPYTGANDFQTGIHFSQTLRYNRFSLTLQEGFYIGLTEEIANKAMYNRGIIRYQISDQFWVRIAMKSHLVILDYPEIGFGFKL